MSLVEDFLTTNEENEVIEAIRKAEKNTSGEIRVHIENKCPYNIEKRVIDVFHFLKMDNTKLQNGVLFYISISDRCFSIYGDKGINNVVPDNFWESTKNLVTSHFQKGSFKQGLVEGILKAGKVMEEFFPWHHFDNDELPNEISKG